MNEEYEASNLEMNYQDNKDYKDVSKKVCIFYL